MRQAPSRAPQARRAWAAPSQAHERLAGSWRGQPRRARALGSAPRKHVPWVCLPRLPGRSPSRFRHGAPSRARLLVASHDELNRAERAALRALASQIALALDSEMLSAEVHRRRGEARFASLVRHASDLITVLADRHHGHLSEPVDRTHPWLRPGRSSRAALRPPCDRRRPGAARAERCLRCGR